MKPQTRKNIFQSTHPRGVRHPKTNHNHHQRRRDFNPRTRVRCDIPSSLATSSCSDFNPRTRVGCDEYSSHSDTSSEHNFNPRTRVGCDSNLCYTIRFWPFQSTHPCGVRHDVGQKPALFPHFNPRTRVVFSIEMVIYKRYFRISIHAPVWGATGKHVINARDQAISIHAPVWGATVFGVALFLC